MLNTEFLQKRCCTCQKLKYKSEFSKDKKGKYGVRGSCKKCQSKRDSIARQMNPHRRAVQMYHDIKTRLKTEPYYKRNKIKFKFKKEDFIKWAEKHIAIFWLHNPGLCASIDRINEKGHYEHNNVQIISLGENLARRKFGNRDEGHNHVDF